MAKTWLIITLYLIDYEGVPKPGCLRIRLNGSYLVIYLCYIGVRYIIYNSLYTHLHLLIAKNTLFYNYTILTLHNGNDTISASS